MPPYGYQDGKNQKHRHHQILVKLSSSCNSHSLLVGNQNGAATSELSLVVFYKTTHTRTMWSGSVIVAIYTEVKTCPHENLPIDVYRSFTQNLEASKVSFGKCAAVGEWAWKLRCQQTTQWSTLKEMSHQPGKDTEELCMPITKRKKRLHTVWPQFYDLLEGADLWRE